MVKVKRALISVSDKTGLDDLVNTLNKYGVEILSTGGTAKKIKSLGVPVKDVSDYTGFPEMMNGRVKTLHPKIHGGLLALRDDMMHMEEAKAQGIQMIDMVIVNLYPFENTVSRDDVTFEEAIENIDIGGPAMLRSSAKNFRDVTVIVDPVDYEAVLKEMEESGGTTTLKTRFRLAKKVFKLTHQYDGAISRYLEGVEV